MHAALMYIHTYIHTYIHKRSTDIILSNHMHIKMFVRVHVHCIKLLTISMNFATGRNFPFVISILRFACWFQKRRPLKNYIYKYKFQIYLIIDDDGYANKKYLKFSSAVAIEPRTLGRALPCGCGRTRRSYRRPDRHWILLAATRSTL